MARVDYGKPLFVCGCFCRSAFLQFFELRCLRSFFEDCFLQFAVLRGPQPPGAEARRFGCRRAHSRRLCSLRSERAYVVSSQALLRSALCCSRAEVRGASFASLRRAGLRLARLKPDCISTSCGRPEHLSFHFTYSRCRQLFIPVCCGVCEQFSSLSF